MSLSSVTTVQNGQSFRSWHCYIIIFEINKIMYEHAGPEKVLILELQKTESLQGLGIAFKTLEVKQVKPGGMVENYNTKAMQDFYDKKLVSAGDKIVSVNGVTVIDDTAVKKMIAEIEFQERFTLGVKKGIKYCL